MDLQYIFSITGTNKIFIWIQDTANVEWNEKRIEKQKKKCTNRPVAAHAMEYLGTFPTQNIE